MLQNHNPGTARIQPLANVQNLPVSFRYRQMRKAFGYDYRLNTLNAIAQKVRLSTSSGERLNQFGCDLQCPSRYGKRPPCRKVLSGHPGLRKPGRD